MNVVTAPSSGNNPTLNEDCAAARPSQSCTDLAINNLPAACQPNSGGTVAMGGVCTFNSQCVSKWCGVPYGTNCGTCVPAPQAGDSCASIPCGSTGLGCLGGTQICQPFVAVGGMCDKTMLCTAGLTCVGATMNTPGTCTTNGNAVDAACDPARVTGPLCSSAAGLYCNAMTKKCVAYLLAGAGMPCGPSAGNTTICTGAAQCVGATAMQLGTCVAPAADGAACDTKMGPPCLTPARCVTGGAAATAGTCQIAIASACQ